MAAPRVETASFRKMLATWTSIAGKGTARVRAISAFWAPSEMSASTRTSVELRIATGRGDTKGALPEASAGSHLATSPFTLIKTPDGGGYYQESSSRSNL